MQSRVVSLPPAPAWPRQRRVYFNLSFSFIAGFFFPPNFFFFFFSALSVRRARVTALFNIFMWAHSSGALSFPAQKCSQTQYIFLHTFPNAETQRLSLALGF